MQSTAPLHTFLVWHDLLFVSLFMTRAAITTVLQSTYIKCPVGEDLCEVIQGFEDKWQMVQSVGALDGCHIPVKPPALNHTDYYNRKGWYSVILQAVVDHNYLFRDVCVGWPGGIHHARVLSNSGLYHKITNKVLLTTNSRNILGSQVYPFLLGDSAYPLKTWLMKPFAHYGSLTNAQQIFNYSLSRGRIVVQNGFGRLKARWQRLTKQNDMDIANVPQVVTACCVLHNICEIDGDTFNETWQETSQLQQPNCPMPSTIPESQATAIRNVLVQHLSNN